MTICSCNDVRSMKKLYLLSDLKSEHYSSQKLANPGEKPLRIFEDLQKHAKDGVKILREAVRILEGS